MVCLPCGPCQTVPQLHRIRTEPAIQTCAAAAQIKLLSQSQDRWLKCIVPFIAEALTLALVAALALALPLVLAAAGLVMEAEADQQGRKTGRQS